MSVTTTLRRALLAAVFACLALAAPAPASSTQESTLMEDDQTVFASPERVNHTMRTLQELGVDRLRVSVFWYLIAPNSGSRDRPPFLGAGPDDPAGYPPPNWDRYDHIVRSARDHGIGLLFTPTAPAPRWATGVPTPSERAGRDDVENSYRPNARDFRDFVAALGTRYSGTYVDESDLGGPPLPRVDVWSIWNEPNHPQWLNPQFAPDPRNRRRLLLASPRIYRSLVDAGFAGLAAAGHTPRSDRILIGETAPFGPLSRGRLRVGPLGFIRDLYCLDSRLRAYRGSAASARGCPSTSAARRRFRAHHPGLFQTAGWAHHPYIYPLFAPPTRSASFPEDVGLSDLRRLTRTLDAVHARHGSRRRLPIYSTEYGYQTDPPDPTIGVRWSTQAAYLNHADYIAFRNRRLASTNQFLLVDTPPIAGFSERDSRRWGSWQSGLITCSQESTDHCAFGTRKPSFAAYQRPIHVTPTLQRRGRPLTIFGQLRFVPNGRRLTVHVQFRANGARRYTTVATRRTSNRRGYLLTGVRARASGSFRLLWVHPDEPGNLIPSRAVRVVVRR